MKFTIIDVEQRSPEWHAARLGRLTGSVAQNILSKGRSGAESVGRRDLRVQLVCDRLTGLVSEDGYVSKDMQRGRELEDEAIAMYEAITGALVRRTGFLRSDERMVGCSLDGDIENFTGILEMKVPKSATHLNYLRGGSLPADYRAQVTHNLWVTGAQWADFVSYDPRFPPKLQLFIRRVPRESVDIDGYEQAAVAFLAEVDREYEALCTLSDPASVLTAAREVVNG